MIPNEYIKNFISPVMTSYTGAEVLLIMEDNKVSHLPIVNNHDFLGLITEFDIFNNDINEAIGNYILSNNVYINDTNHMFDAIRLVCEHRLTLLPVVDSQKKYIGYIELVDVISYIGNHFSINNPGGIIELEMNIHDYSITQIAQIVEENDAKILHLGITTLSDTSKIIVTLKVNKIDITHLLQTFTRFEYSIVGSYGKDEMWEYLKDRYDSFMRYINT